MTLSPGSRLGPYEIQSAIGAGGMGEVYKARDTRLDRSVAIKILPSDVGADPDRRARFEREARALARIEHPNILAVHDVGRDAAASSPGAATSFAVTELLVGETLRERLARERLSWRRAVEIAAAVADGLAAAHGQGIVHRDLKPENLFLTADGRVKILDFGLAATAPSPDSAAETGASPAGATAPGTVLGTLGYMSPEQVHGTEVDGRADLFALGCVLYEMVAGRRAFARPTAGETLAAILAAPVPELSSVATDAPPDLARIVARCVEKQPGARFQSAADLAFALRALLAAPVGAIGAATPPPSRRRAWALGGFATVALAALIAGAAIWWRQAPAAAPVAPNAGLDPAKVVVAVFDNQTGDAALDSVGLLISQTVFHRLTLIPGVKAAPNPVVPVAGPGLPRSALAAGGNPVRNLAERTGAGLVVTGSYFVDGSNLRLQGQLVDAATGAVLTSYEPESGDRAGPSDVVERLARRVMGHLALRFKAGFEPYAATQRPPRYDAYLEYLQAASAFGADYPGTIRHLNDALSIDPEYLEARCLLAFAWLNIGRPVEADAALRPAEEPAALSRATPQEQAHVRWARGLLDGARQAVVAARELARVSADPWAWYKLGISEAGVNRPRAAIEAIEHIRLGDMPAGSAPNTSWPLANLAAYYHEVAEYDKQLDAAKLGQQHYPGIAAFFGAEVGGLVAVGRLDDVDGVIARAEQASLQTGGTGTVLVGATRELAAHGHEEASRAMALRAAAWFRQRMPTAKPDETAALRASLAASLLFAGGCAEAVRIRGDLAREEPGDLEALGDYGVTLALCGRPRAEAQKIADALARIDRPFLRGGHHFARARVLAALGDREDAMAALEAAFAQGQRWSGLEIHLDRAFAPLRDYPPFIELMKPKG